MNNEIITYLSKYINVSDELKKSLNQAPLIKKHKAGTPLLNEGDNYELAYFVLKGCLRSFKIKNGEDITIDFYLDEQPVLPIGGGDSISDFNLECLEDSVILASNEKIEKEIIAKHPELKSLCLKMSEVLADKLQREYSQYKTSTPEERYRTLVEQKPEVIQRVPQYKIASYLGIKPESLSRIKKRILS